LENRPWRDFIVPEMVAEPWEWADMHSRELPRHKTVNQGFSPASIEWIGRGVLVVECQAHTRSDVPLFDE
jgi:hypothetical protein